MADPSHQGLPVDEDRLRHDQGLRDNAHDPPPPLHPDRTRGHRRSAFHQQTLRSRRLIRAAERAGFCPTAVNATVPSNSPMGLDVYAWLAQRLCRVTSPQFVSWVALKD